MAFAEKLKEIESYLKKIEELNHSLENRKELNRLQADLIKEYLRDLYELYVSLENEVRSDEVASAKQESKEVAVEKSIEPPIEEKIAVEVVAEAPATEPKLQKAEITETESALAKTVENKEEAISLFEKFQQESDGTELNRKKVTDKALSELIPLNEKFMFIIEFFDNSISSYESTIAELDKLNTKTEVLDYMQQNAWSKEIMESQQDLIDRFIRIIDLKYTD